MDPIEKDSQMNNALRLHRTLRDQFQNLGPVHESDEQVHFHQGPQGQATPCFERTCGNPRLDV